PRSAAAGRRSSAPRPASWGRPGRCPAAGAAAWGPCLACGRGRRRGSSRGRRRRGWSNASVPRRADGGWGDALRVRTAGGKGEGRGGKRGRERSCREPQASALLRARLRLAAKRGSFARLNLLHRLLDGVAEGLVLLEVLGGAEVAEGVQRVLVRGGGNMAQRRRGVDAAVSVLVRVLLAAGGGLEHA